MCLHYPYLQSSHTYNLIGVIEEIGQDIKNGGFREDEFLWEMKANVNHFIFELGKTDVLMINSLHNTHFQILRAKLMSIHVNG